MEPFSVVARSIHVRLHAPRQDPRAPTLGGEHPAGRPGRQALRPGRPPRGSALPRRSVRQQAVLRRQPQPGGFQLRMPRRRAPTPGPQALMRPSPMSPSLARILAVLMLAGLSTACSDTNPTAPTPGLDFAGITLSIDPTPITATPPPSPRLSFS